MAAAASSLFCTSLAMRSSALVGWFADIGLADRLEVGGKGGNLGELTHAGIQVPPGFVLKTAAFERFIHALESESPVRERVESLEADDLGAMTALSAQLRARFAAAPLPADVADAIASAYQELGNGAAQSGVAVRSSATTEDAADASFAGLQDTYLWIKGAAETARMVQHCWASLYSVESISYRLQRRIPEHGVAMAVVVQIMVDARSAGVMFT